jgi:eukaryotic-like serine/threonine-protein kinase
MPVETDILPPRYRSPRRIAVGGMGEIYRATDVALGRAVAVKVLSARYAGNEDIRSRFTREALAAARLSSEPYVVTVFDVGEHAQRPFIVMEYLGGGSLEERLREGAQDAGQALDWLEQAAIALDAAHRHGVVHRDVKPGNLLLDRNGNVHVADFGIASAAGMDALTLTGTVLGTAGYLAPEQAQGDQATAASDRYSLAIVAYELLSGRRPFESDSITAEAAAHVHEEVPAVSTMRLGLPVELDAVFRRALAKDPSRRYETAAEFVAALRTAFAEAAGATRTFAAATPVRAEPARRPHAPVGQWTVLGALLALAAIGGAIAAILLTGGGNGTKTAAHRSPARTVTTVLTQQGKATTVTAPAPASSGSAGSGSGSGSGSLSGLELNNAGYTKMQAVDCAGALPLLRQAVAKLSGVGYPTEAYANYNLGYTLLQLGSCNEAVPYLQQAKSLEPQRHEPKDALQRARHCKT